MVRADGGFVKDPGSKGMVVEVEKEVPEVNRPFPQGGISRDKLKAGRAMFEHPIEQWILIGILSGLAGWIIARMTSVSSKECASLRHLCGKEQETVTQKETTCIEEMNAKVSRIEDIVTEMVNIQLAICHELRVNVDTSVLIKAAMRSAAD